MTSHLIFSLYYRSLLPPNEEGVGEECEVYCGDGCLLASWACVVDGWEVVTP